MCSSPVQIQALAHKQSLAALVRVTCEQHGTQAATISTLELVDLLVENHRRRVRVGR